MKSIPPILFHICMLIFHYKHIFTFILYNNCDTPYLSSQTQIYLYLYYTTTAIPQGSITILYLYPWSYLYETTLNKIPWHLKISGHVIYMTYRKDI